jgi:glycosyltransferase involved in cell wall biosynthesis
VRILHVIANVAPREGGPSKAVLEMSAALVQEGHDVDVVTTALAHRGSWFKRPSRRDLLAEPIGIRLLRDGYYITFCKPAWPTRWGLSYEMVNVLRTLIPGADIVHIHSLYLFHTLLASRLAAFYHVPYIIRPHGTLDPYIRRRHQVLKKLYHALIENATLRRAAAVHFTTSEERDLALPALLSGSRTCVVPLGVSLREFENFPERAATRRALGIDDRTLVWLFLGRLNHKKGLDLLAQAFVQFCRHCSDTLLLVAGPDDDGLGRRFKSECQRGGVAERVRLPGFVDRGQVPQILAVADLWILPSYSENFGIGVVEAMAAQLPVLITDKVNIWQAVQESGAGVVIRAETTSVLEGMLRLARLSPQERAAMGQRGRELCRRTFSWQNSARQLTALYAQIAKRHGRS